MKLCFSTAGGWCILTLDTSVLILNARRMSSSTYGMSLADCGPTAGYMISRSPLLTLISQECRLKVFLGQSLNWFSSLALSPENSLPTDKVNNGPRPRSCLSVSRFMLECQLPVPDQTHVESEIVLMLRYSQVISNTSRYLNVNQIRALFHSVPIFSSGSVFCIFIQRQTTQMRLCVKVVLDIHLVGRLARH